MRYLITLCLLFCMSCNLADPEVESAPFAQIEVPEYEELGDKFENVSFFLWKDTVPRTQTISEVLKLAARYEALNAKTAPIRKKRAALEADEEYQGLLGMQAAKQAALRECERAFDRVRSELAKTEAKLLAKFQELDAEHQKELPDREKIKELREQASKLQKAASQLLAVAKASEGKTLQLERSLNLIATRLASHTRAIETLRISSAPIESEQDGVMKALEQKSEWPKSLPAEVLIKKSDFGLVPGLEIKGWHFAGEEKPRDFTSLGENPTIRDVNYTKRGGTLAFSVCVYEDKEQKRISAAYRFRLMRRKTEAENVFIYTGDVWRNRPIEIEGGDDVEQPGDGQQDENLPNEGDERSPAPPDEEEEEFEEETVSREYDCVELSLLRVPGKTRSGMAKISNQKI